MQVTIETATFREGAVTAARVVRSAGALHLRASGDRLSILAASPECRYHCRLAARVERAGEAALPAGPSRELLQRLDGEAIRLAGTSKTLVLEAGRARSTFALLPAEPPVLPTGEPRLTVPAPVLRRALEQVAIAASRTDDLPGLTGLLIEVQGSECLFTAADGYRLARRAIATEAASEGQWLVPAAAARLLARVLPVTSAPVVLVDAGTALIARWERSELAMTLLAPHYPDIQDVLARAPAEPDVIMAGPELAAALRAVGTLATDDHPSVRLRTQGERLELLAGDAGRGWARGTITAELVKRPLETVLARAYLADAVRVLGKGRVGLAAAAGPVLVRSLADAASHLIMPIAVEPGRWQEAEAG